MVGQSFEGRNLLKDSLRLVWADLSLSNTQNINLSNASLINANPPATIFAQTHPAVTDRVKRLIDIVGALIGLIVTAILLIPIALAIYLDNPGPIFFSQIRCGFNGRPFRLWKFRSMVVNAECLQHLVSNEAKGNIFKNRRDPRVTRVGRFLRGTSLDEFPQFWNILKGDMSLVGTRPPTLDEVKQYQSRHFQRLLVKPGLTGEWQVHGRSQVTDFEQMVFMDVAYQRKWSIAYDLELILKTIVVVLLRIGAC